MQSDIILFTEIFMCILMIINVILLVKDGGGFELNKKKELHNDFWKINDNSFLYYCIYAIKLWNNK